MVRLFPVSTSVTCFFALTLFGMCQDESGLSLMETTWANSEAIHNYDVSYKHWQGFSPSEPWSEDFSEHTECVTIGRVVVDRKTERIFFVREMILDLATKQKKKIDCFTWTKGVAKAYSKDSPRPYTTKLDFVKFNARYQVPIVELTLARFPCTLAKANLEEIHNDSSLLYQNSRCIRYPDGSARVSAFRESTHLQMDVIFDPASSMPTSFVMSECDPKSHTVIRKLLKGSPRFEKVKEIYRIASITYDRPEYAGQNLTLQSVGTCDFTWHQFNEELIQFPIFEDGLFDIAEAERFLRQGNVEQGK